MKLEQEFINEFVASKSISILCFSPNVDGKTNDAPIFQEAIDFISSNGGGTLVVPEGKYCVGSIELKNNVTIELMKGAYLKMSDSLDDFIDYNTAIDTTLTRPSWENCEYDGKPRKLFIYAKEQSYICVCGEGIIDGNEKIFYGKVTKWHIEGAFYPRIPLLFFEGCQNISLLNFNIKKSAFWTCHFVGSKDILVEGLNIDNNLKMTNSDGIDPDHCQNVIIRNCNISAADDCIVLKTTEAYKHYGPTENIKVINCNLRSTSAAIKIGTESVSDFENISFEDINIYGSNRGISLQLRDEGNISNISFNNINISTRMFSPEHWWGKAEPIAITAVPRHVDTRIGSISNISFDNINCDSENGIFIYGCEKNIHDIDFKNVNISLCQKTHWDKNIHDIRPYYKDGILNDNLAFIHIEEASHITLNHVTCRYDEELESYFPTDIIVRHSEYIDYNPNKTNY